MPLPAVLLQRLKKRGIIKQQGGTFFIRIFAHLI